MPKTKPPTKFVITIKITLEDPNVDYAVALAYKGRIAELAGDLAPGESSTVGSSIEDWAQLQARRSQLYNRIVTAMRTNPTATLPERIFSLLQEMGYVPQT